MSYKWTRILILALITTLTAALLTACGEERTVDYTIGGIAEEQEEVQTEEKEEGQERESAGEEQAQSEGGKIGLAQFKGEEAWKDTWMIKIGEEEQDGEIVDIFADVRVDAKIIVPQTKQMSVVEVIETEFDAEYKERLAKTIFDSGEIYYGNAANLPKKDIEKLWPEYEAGAYIMADEPFHFEEWNNEWSDCYKAYENLENLKDTYTPAAEYSVNKYIGSYEDRLYRLTFLEDEEDRENVARYMKRITLEAKDLYEVCPEKFKEQENLACTPWMLGDRIENRCEISEKEALKEAKEFVDELGLDYMVFAFSRPLAWGNVPEVISITDTEETDDWGVNGYVFYFDLGLDDVSFVQYGIEDDYFDWTVNTGENEEKVYSLKSVLQIYITDTGIIKAVVDNPVEITSVSENVELLPLDTVKEIIKKETNTQWETFRFNVHYMYYPMDMNEMELIYFRIRDKDNPGKYSYVPAWRLASVLKEEASHGIDIRYPVLINAIDGTVIDFYDET